MAENYTVYFRGTNTFGRLVYGQVRSLWNKCHTGQVRSGLQSVQLNFRSFQVTSGHFQVISGHSFKVISGHVTSGQVKMFQN